MRRWALLVAVLPLCCVVHDIIENDKNLGKIS
jgi:hypothetical protein